MVKGYDQIPRVDFTESFAPTVSDTTLHTMLMSTQMYADGEWTVEVIDIETAFLEADLKEEVWIEIPDGYEFAFGEIDWARYVMLLLKAMYGLVQAPRAFYETFRKIPTSADIGMLQSKVDPCLFYKQDGSGSLTALMAVSYTHLTLPTNREV